jgi:arginine deiminase
MKSKIQKKRDELEKVIKEAGEHFMEVTHRELLHKALNFADTERLKWFKELVEDVEVEIFLSDVYDKKRKKRVKLPQELLDFQSFFWEYIKKKFITKINQELKKSKEKK